MKERGRFNGCVMLRFKMIRIRFEIVGRFTSGNGKLGGDNASGAVDNN